MKKNKIAIILVALLAPLTFWLVINKSTNGTIKKELRDFAVRDTASITKIFMADRSNHSVTLERLGNGDWQVEGKYVANKGVVDNLLETIKNIEVMSPVPNAAKETIIKSLASSSVKIEIYKKDGLVKSYYVGGETQDGLATYMLLSDPKTGENSSAPFIMFMPGFNGNVGVRYFTDLRDWRARFVFRYYPDDIASVKVEYIEELDNSFEVFNNGNNSFEVKDLKKNALILDGDVMKMKRYLSYYQNIQYEILKNDAADSLKDAVFKNMAFAKITVTNKKNEQNAITLYHMPHKIEGLEIAGKPIKYDPDHMYTFINDGKDFVSVQYFVFGKLLQTPGYFMSKPKV